MMSPPGSASHRSTRPLITGLVLAGGQGRRMGGADKGLLDLEGRPLIEHVLRRFAPQVDEVLVSANRNRDRYEAMGHRVVADADGAYNGPLAGLLAGLAAAQHDWVVTVPCDTPDLPVDLVARLWAGLDAAQARVAIARTGVQVHPVFWLGPVSLAANLADFLARGGRSFRDWLAPLDCVEVSFDEAESAFANVNTREDLSAREARTR